MRRKSNYFRPRGGFLLTSFLLLWHMLCQKQAALPDAINIRQSLTHIGGIRSYASCIQHTATLFRLSDRNRTDHQAIGIRCSAVASALDYADSEESGQQAGISRH